MLLTGNFGAGGACTGRRSKPPWATDCGFPRVVPDNNVTDRQPAVVSIVSLGVIGLSRSLGPDTQVLALLAQLP